MTITQSHQRFAVPAPIPARTRAGQRWLNARLRVKLLSVFLLAFLLLLPPIAIGVTLYQRLTEARTVSEARSENVEDLDALWSSLVTASTAIDLYAILGFDEPQYVDQYASVAADVPAEIVDLEDDLPPGLQEPGHEVATKFQALFATFDAVAGFDSPTYTDTPTDEAMLTVRPGNLVDLLVETTTARAAVNVAVADLDTRLEARQAAARQEVTGLQKRMLWATLASLVLALAAASAGTYAVASGLVRRIMQIVRNGERFTQGSPMHPIAASTDEIGRLNESIAFAGELIEERRDEAVAATRTAVAATQAKDELLSRVSHELKTPLTAMIGFGELLEEDDDLSPESRADAARIVGAGHRLHALIEELLDIKAIEAGKLALTIGPVRVPEVVDDAISLVRSLPAARSLTITSACPDDVVVAADPRRLREVLLNLLSNAVKYNRPGGSVELVADRSGDIVRIGVTDTGFGISADDRELLFRPFERLGAAETDIEGTGVGLSLTKHVVEAMGGTIGVDSTPGRGSTFWFRLPSAHLPPRADSEPDVEASGVGSTR
jgi:signal transduction histidine kinase